MTATTETGRPAGSVAPPLGKRHRQIVTPEGVPLTVELADRGSRAAAFALDVVFIILVLVIGGIALALLGGLIHVWALVIGILGFFLLRVFYFPYAELRLRGATPGKRLLGLRVIDRNGRPLKPEAIVVRNLMREVEVFIPVTLLIFAGATGFGDIANVLLTVWLGIFTLMPLFNRDGLRVGDMVAGTLVIMAPKAALLPDLAGASGRSRVPLTVQHDAPREARYRFTPAQLDFYGVYELQTLEAVLRRADADNLQARQEIARRIRAKIGWPDASQGTVEERGFDATAFLEAFYAAQRAQLERRMLFGKRRRDKHDRS
ncbi:MAG TPA: RDD family protein [Dongiaceae bacterium]|nr:RDD family protein [Dongiaceae bacterium]